MAGRWTGTKPLPQLMFSQATDTYIRHPCPNVLNHNSQET